ncbi:MAG: patatin-like phospholipase family protein [Alphaproteobacteria bacterium]|nr:patatin-like phospholipase family protein [Alphaproteobacteria bacterium]MDE2629633.1 patatin-like phospholipase family protein [Alphaproteobacteria bacterium]
MNMAFLSSFRSGQETIYPESLRQHLSVFPLLAEVGDAAMKRLLAEANWFGLPGGAVLKRDGDNDSALFLVVTGSLGVFVDGRQVAHVPPGETVGEMSLLSRERHTAQLVALRDSELLRISPEGFDALIARHPRVMLSMMRVLVRRLHDTTRSPHDASRPKTFAIVPLQDGLGHEPIAHRLAGTLVDMGSKAAVLDAAAGEQSAEWFNTFEAAHDVVFYRGDAPDTSWTKHCLRQADRIFFLARSDIPLPAGPLPAVKENVCGLPVLLLLHPGGGDRELPEHFALQSGEFQSHHHVRAGRSDDIRRLARFIAGRAVGLVLGGGGARGFAHIGVVKALTEAGVPFDFLGGASMGAIIAAGLAAEWSVEEITERMRSAFVTSNPISDYTLPLIALVRGKKVSALLRKDFGEMRIEELAKPFFCVSSDLTSGRIHVHRNGPVWRTLRASVALPGILPPVTHHGHLLVDGGVMNNLPVDVMRERNVGPLIASDVTGEVDLSVRDSRYGERPVWSLLWQRMRGTPSIVSILMRSGTVGSEAQRRLVREQADYLFEPPLPDLGLRDWKMFDRAVAEGYAHAQVVIEKHGVPLTDVWSEGPAVSMPHPGELAAG